MDPIVQYIVLRKDLKGYGKGELCAQAAHAAVAAIHAYRDELDTKEYLKELGSMRKVVLAVSD